MQNWTKMKRKVRQLKFSDIAKKSEIKHSKCLHDSLHLKQKCLLIKQMNNHSFFIESVHVYPFYYSLYFCKNLILLGNLNCQCCASTAHALYYSVYSLLRKSPFLGKVPSCQPRPWWVSPGRVRPFTTFPSWSHWTQNTVKICRI